MATLYTFSEAEISLLKEMANSYRGRRRNTSNRSDDDYWDESQNSFTYIALTPDEGIDALTQPGTGTGTNFPDAEGDIPGSAECDIYRIYPPDTLGGLYTLRAITYLTETVYNLSQSAVEGNRWVLITQDRFANWIITDTLAGGIAGSSDVWVSLNSNIPVLTMELGTGTGTGVGDGKLYDGTVQNMIPNGLGFTVGHPCWVFTPMGLDLSAQGPPFYYRAVPDGTYNPFDEEGERPLYYAIGGWLSSVLCVSGQLVNIAY
jgi:hypothetical protein